MSPHCLVACPAEALAQLAEELRAGSVGDKERAVSMLSSLTLYVDHHDAILAAGVLPSLLVSVKDERLVPQVGGLDPCPETQNPRCWCRSGTRGWCRRRGEKGLLHYFVEASTNLSS